MDDFINEVTNEITEEITNLPEIAQIVAEQ
jgi:hypothetical protein